MNMNIKIQARGKITVDEWGGKVYIDGVSLDKKIAEALAIKGVPENPVAQVTVVLNIQDTANMTTYVNGQIYIPEEPEEEKEGQADD